MQKLGSSTAGLKPTEIWHVDRVNVSNKLVVVISLHHRLCLTYPKRKTDYATKNLIVAEESPLILNTQKNGRRDTAIFGRLMCCYPFFA